MRTPRLLAAGVTAVLALTVLTACGDEYEDKGASAPTASAASEAVELQPCDESVKSGPEASKKVGAAPEIAKPEGAPPCELVVTDLVEGEGKAVTDLTKKYSWNYEGVSWSTGEVFDSSYDRGAPVDFALQQVIEGWTEGLQGIKPGGRRMLVIPSEQAYGDTPPPGSGIAPGETLVFVVDLVGPAKGA